MADEKKIVKNSESKETPKKGIIDLTEKVEVEILKGAPFYTEGEKVFMSPQVAKKAIARGWAKGKVAETV